MKNSLFMLTSKIQVAQRTQLYHSEGDPDSFLIKGWKCPEVPFWKSLLYLVLKSFDIKLHHHTLSK